MELGEIKLKAEKNFYFFCKAVMGMAEFTRPLHTDLCAFIQSPPLSKQALTPRNCFKTSAFTCLPLHMWIQPPERNIYFPGMDGRDTRILYAGETMDLAMKRTTWVMRRLESHELFRTLWPHCIWPDLNRVPVKWTMSEFTIPRIRDYLEGSLTAIGVDGAITGNHFDVLIKDDLISLDAALSPELMQTSITWDKEAKSLMNDPETTREYYVGTRWANYDLYVELEERKPNMARFFRSIIWEGQPLFPQRFPMRVIEDLKREQGDLFWLNYMNTAANTAQTAFDANLLRYYSLDGDRVDYADDFEQDLIIQANADKLTSTQDEFSQSITEPLGTDYPGEKETGATIGPWYKRERARQVRAGQVRPSIRRRGGTSFGTTNGA